MTDSRSHQPPFTVQARLDVMIPMRDGVRLATDIFLPCDPETGNPADSPRPVLLDRTPYGKRGRLERHGEWFAKRGYVVAIQDCRGRFESEGHFYIFKNEPEDGYDTVEWLAERPYCDGQVGTIGTSYGAWVQNALATQDPPHLAAMFVNQGAANAREATFRHHGAFELRWLCWAFTLGAVFAPRCLEDPVLQQKFVDVDLREELANLPLRRGQSTMRHLPRYEDWLFDIMSSGSATDDLWQSPGLNFEKHYEQSADVPTVYAGGWYDSYIRATVKNFENLSQMKESDHFLIMGPWTHGWDEYPLPSWNKSYSGEVEFGENAFKDYQTTRLRFFDHYLKGRGTWADQPTVEYYSMGNGDGSTTRQERLVHGGVWESSDDWPPPNVDERQYYLNEHGRLTINKPRTADSCSSYRFDPAEPVPTIGGNCSSYITFEPRSESLLEYPADQRKWIDLTGRGGWDQRTRPDMVFARPPYTELEKRNDVLVFRTEPFQEPAVITGTVEVVLYVSTDGPDTDFTAKLIHEYPPSAERPNGFALNLSDSICRLRYRNYRDQPDLVQAGEIYQIKIELYPTSNQFKPGHQLRLDISSSNFPRYDINPNTGGPLEGDPDYRVASNTIYHNEEYPSRIDLPIQKSSSN